MSEVLMPESFKETFRIQLWDSYSLKINDVEYKCNFE